LAPFFIFLHVGVFDFNCSQGLPLIEPAETWYNEQECFLSFCGVIHNAYTERAVAFFLIIALAAGLGGAERITGHMQFFVAVRAFIFKKSLEQIKHA
jgi:hypothetical protein